VIHSGGNNTEQYALVNAGARPHVIRPRHARILKFQRGYRAATRPRVIGSHAAARYGPVVTAQAVHHPGFEAREFDETIAKEYAPRFREDMRRALDEGAV